MRKIIIVLLTVFTITAYGQTKKEKAYNLSVKATEEMESGNIKGAIKIFGKAKKLDPDEINYPYQIAYANYLKKDYKESIEVLKELLDHPNVTDSIYIMLATCYDKSKESANVAATYEAAIKAFPKSGMFYLKRGNLDRKRKKYDKALVYYEKGIEAQPNFLLNYYWATKLYLNSTDKVWGLIYGEIFINLEENNDQTKEISMLLFNTYKTQIKFDSEGSVIVHFSKNASISGLADSTNIKLPYGEGVYVPLLLKAMVKEEGIDLESLNRIRTKFVEAYFNNGYDKTYPNVLFDYQNEINYYGHIEPYNKWVLRKGDEAAFSEWRDSNKIQWNSFVTWLAKNPLKINDTQKFYREQY